MDRLVHSLPILRSEEAEGYRAAERESVAKSLAEIKNEQFRDFALSFLRKLLRWLAHNLGLRLKFL